MGRQRHQPDEDPHHRATRTPTPARAARAYAIHREDLADDELDAIEGVPVVTLARAIRECAADHAALDLLEQAVRTGAASGLLDRTKTAALQRELGLDQIAADRA